MGYIMNSKFKQAIYRFQCLWLKNINIIDINKYTGYPHNKRYSRSTTEDHKREISFSRDPLLKIFNISCNIISTYQLQKIWMNIWARVYLTKNKKIIMISYFSILDFTGNVLYEMQFSLSKSNLKYFHTQLHTHNNARE